MPYDVQVGPYTKLALPSRVRAVRRRPKHLFVRGPVPIDVIARCRALHPEALPLLLRIKAEADTLGAPVLVGAALGRSIGLHPKARARALRALERGELIEVERVQGRAPRVWIAPDLFVVPR